MLDSERMIETPTVPRPVRTGRASGVARLLRVLLALALAVALGILIYEGIRSRVATASAVKTETLNLAVPTVSVAQPRIGAMSNEIVLPGSIQAFVDSPVYARASGYLKSWRTDIGARVKAGQVLAEIDAPELDQQVTQAHEAVDQARAAVDQAAANLEQGKANAELARVTAQRWSNLVGKGAVSRQENDTYQAQYQAQAANVQSLEKAVAASRSSLAAIQANLGRLEDLQAFKVVKAPFDGVITARNTDVGMLINAGNGGVAQELFHIASVSKLRVFVSVPQVYARSAVPGTPADLTLAEFPGRRFRGQLVRNAEAIDASTRTLLSEVDLDNSTGELRPGAYAEVHLKFPASVPTVIVPVGAILFRSEGLRIGVVRDGKAQLLPVVLGKDYGTEVEVVSGISPEDQVIMNPPDSLASGIAVRVVPRNASTPNK
jgi:RND family efflux transporter MFP subunit